MLEQLTNIVNCSKIRPADETSAVMDWFQPLLDKLNGRSIRWVQTCGPGSPSSHLNAWHDSETLLHETVVKIVTKAHGKAVGLNVSWDARA